GRVRTRMLVLADCDLAAALGAGHRDRRDLAGEESLRLGGGEFLLRAEREPVGGFARDREVAAHIVGGLRHGVLAEALADLRIGEARADRRIEDAGVARVGALAL